MAQHNANLLVSGTVTAASGVFGQSLTVSGVPVDIGGGVSDPLNIGTVNASLSLTISGQPVATGTTGGGGAALTVREVDGTPSVSNVDTIVVSNDTLTDDGGGQVTIQTGGTGGGGGGSGDSGRRFQGAVVTTTSGNSIAHGFQYNLAWDTITYDTSGFYDAGQVSRLTVPVGSGITHVVLRGSVQWDDDTTVVGHRFMDIKHNGIAIDPDVSVKIPNVHMSSPANSTAHQVESFPVPVADGDYFELTVTQANESSNTVDTLSSRTWFSIEDVTPVSGTGGGTGTIEAVNTITSGTVTITGAGTVDVTTEGQVITVSGSGSAGATTFSGTYFNPDVPPEFPSQFDDEFDTGRFNDNGKWTIWDPGTNFNADPSQGYPNRLSLAQGGDSNNEFSGVFQTLNLPGDQNWSIDAKFIMTALATHDGTVEVGLMLGEDLTSNPSTSDFYSLIIRQDTTSPTNLILIFREHTGYTHTGTQIGTNVDIGEDVGRPVYLRMVNEIAGNDIECSYSLDGQSWKQQWVEGTRNFVPAEIGLIVMNQRSSSSNQGAQVDFFRACTSGTLEGDQKLGSFSPSTRTRPTFGRLIHTIASGTELSGGGGGGGGSADTLQDAYDNGTGTISTTGGKPFELTGTGELVAVTGTFSDGLTVGGASTFIDSGSITTATGTFTDSLTISGVPINIDFVPGFRGALISKSSNQIISTGAGNVVVTWDTPRYDTDNLFDDTNDTFVIPAGINKVIVRAQIVSTLASLGPTADAFAFMQINGSTEPGNPSFRSALADTNTGNGTLLMHSAPIDVVEGDVLRIVANQTTGSDWTLQTSDATWFSIEVVDPVATSPNHLTSISGTFSESLTISGVPVSTGTGGGGAGTITDINTTATGPSVTITGVGGINTITNGNTITVSGGQFSPGFRGALVATTSGIDVPTGSTATQLPFDLIIYDTDGFHSSSSDPNRLTIPAGINKVQVSATSRWIDEAQNSDTGRAFWVDHRDSSGSSKSIYDVAGQAGIEGSQERTGMSSRTPVIDVVEGDYFEANARHNAGVTLTIEGASNRRTSFAIEVIDPAPAPGPSLTGKQAFRGARVTTSSGVTLPHNTHTFMPFDTVDYDTDGFANLSTFDHGFIIPAGVTRVIIRASGLFTQNGTGYRTWQIRRNQLTDNEFVTSDTEDGSSNTATVVDTQTWVLSVSEGETYGIRALQSSGGDLDIIVSNTTYISIEVVEDNEPVTFNDFVAASGTFTDSLTISGVPVSTGTGGGGTSTIDDINGITTGSVTITGSGGIQTITDGQVITISGAGVATASGSYWNPDAPPVSGTGPSDEFDVEPLASGTAASPGKWQTFNPQGSLTLGGANEPRIIDAGFYFRVVNPTGNWAGFVNTDVQDAINTALGKGIGWKVDLKISNGTRVDEEFASGLFLSDTDAYDDQANANLRYVVVNGPDGDDHNGATILRTNTVNITAGDGLHASDVKSPATASTSDGQPVGGGAYLRISYSDANQEYGFQYSKDGLLYHSLQVVSSGSLGFNAKSVGFMAIQDGGGGGGSLAQFFRFSENTEARDFLRFTDQEPLRGRRVFAEPAATIPADLTVNSITAVTGTFTEGLTIGGSTVDITPTRVTAPEGRFVDTLTVSGIPVSLGGSGGGSGTIEDINTTATGPSVTITGVGSIQTITDGNTVTISGLSQVGNSRYDAHIPPDVPSQYDDEFDLPAGSSPNSDVWTTFDPGSDLSTMQILQDPSRLYINTSNNGEFVGITRTDLDQTFSWSAYTYVRPHFRSSRSGAFDNFHGIVLVEDINSPSTSNLLFCGVFIEKPSTGTNIDVAGRVGIWEFDQFDDATPLIANSDSHYDDNSTGGVFIKVSYNVGLDRVGVQWSNDGVAWQQSSLVDIDTGTPVMTTFNAVGIMSRTDGETGNSASFGLFRVDFSGESTTTPMPAGFLGGAIEDPGFTEMTAISGTFSESLTISGVPVSTGIGDPLVINELVAVTGTFTDGLTVGGGTSRIFSDRVETDKLVLGGEEITEITATGIAASGTIWMADAPPASGTPFDDEFIDAATLTSDWTTFDPGSNSPIISIPGPGFLRMRDPSTADEWSGIFRDAPTPDQGWTIYTKVSLTTRAFSGTDDAWAGICVFEDATSSPSTTDMAGIFLRIDEPSGNIAEVRSGSFTAYNATIASSASFTLNDWPGNSIYLRIRYEQSLNKIVCEAGTDGMAFSQLGEVALSYDPAEFGLVMKRVAGSNTIAHFDFFRLREEQNRLGYLQGSPVAIFHPGQTVSATATGPSAPEFVGAMISTSSGIVVPNGVEIELNYDEVHHDFGGLVDLGTYDKGFTIPAEHANAWWVLKASVRWETITVDADVYIQVNGIGQGTGHGLHRLAQVSTANEPFSQMLTTHPFMLPAGATIGLKARHGRASDYTIEDFFQNTWLSIERVAVSGTG